MSALVQHKAPSFTAQAIMPDGTEQPVSLSDYQGQPVVLFFYPKDFTFV
jgi:alkyl hydroperoxide reductase subunit AhpC